MRFSESWASRVGSVFNTMPRDGSNRLTVWLPRTSMERRFTEVLENKGVHICLDGPTGTGKTSLALTQLHRSKVKYALVQITQLMDWPEFCKRLVSPGNNDESALSAEFELGIDKGLPQGKFRVALGAKSRPSDNIEFIELVVKSWTEHDVCQNIVKENIALLIDDFERANENIVRRVSDMCKLLTQSYQGPNAKIIVVGTDDICKRLFEANPSLESRLEEVSLGTLPDKNESWKFILLGFDALKLGHPANDYRVTKEQLLECIEYVYEAADGLPKTLNEIGREISLKGVARTRITPKDIKDVAGPMPVKHLKIFRSEFPKIVKCVEGNPAVRAVLLHLYSEGIGQIHHWTDVESALQPDYSVDQIENAICELINSNFLIRTGIYGDVLFVAKPTLAHTLGVLVANPQKYDLPRSFYGKDGQLVFPFFKKDEQLALPDSNNKDS